jgi:RES domain-containing protein
MTDHHIYSSWGRYDLPGEENAMYLSKTLAGNQTELVPHYGEWSDFSIYKYSNIQADNLLDLTNDAILQQLGLEFDQLTKVLEDKTIMYEFTNELAKWAKQKGYNGLVVPGARGAKNYENVIIFEQSYINQILQGKTQTQIPK